MMFSKAQQEIVDLALQGKRLKEVVMLLDKSEDEILLETPAEWYTVLQAGNEEIREYCLSCQLPLGCSRSCHRTLSGSQ